MDSNEISELKRLHFENVIWIVFAGLCVLNILGDNDEIFYIERNDVSYKNEANTIFELTLTMTFFIYIFLIVILNSLIKQVLIKSHYMRLKY